MTSLTDHAYAKINLTLDIGPPRPDGYHPIRSIMQTIALHDTLTVTHTPKSPGIVLEVTGEEAEGIPTDSSNLVCRAAAMLASPLAGLHILLHKRIPSQAGLGGGSSDAASTLRAVNTLLGLGQSRARLVEIGAALGADIPFFLTGGTALVEGRGEIVTPLPPLTPRWHFVLAKPSVGISTAAAYAALDTDLSRIPGAATEAWLRGSRRPANDFETVIFRDSPQIASVAAYFRKTAESGESFTPLLCGSGATVLCRFSTQEKATQIAEEIRTIQQASVWVTSTQEITE